MKRSVNQDDVSAYHLFYADAVGSPGTDMTFFDWAMAREKRGIHSVTRTCLRVQGGSSTLAWWEQHLREQGVAVAASGVGERDGRLTLDFEDTEGQRLSLVDDSGKGDAPVSWSDSPVPAAFQIRGLGPIVMSVPDLEPTDIVLTRVLEMEVVRDYPHPDNPQQRVVVYNTLGESADSEPHTELHVAVQPDLPSAQPGAGGVHHVAFRTPTDESYHAWAERLNKLRIPNSGAVDRYYFRSLYFREPNGVLFEIATDGPGFGVDEDMKTLGDKVVLPPFLESRRAEIVAHLKPID